MIKLSNTDKIAFFTDPHIGARNSSHFFRQHNAAYWRDEFFPRIKNEGIKLIFCLGDFFDSRNSISLHDISYVMNEWLPMLNDSGATLYVIAGNHDVAYRNTNEINSLSLLKSSPNVIVIDDTIEVVSPYDDGPNFVLCPWINNNNYDRLMEDLNHYATKDHILLGHFEIQGMKMYKTSKICEHGIKPEVFKKFLKVFSGHFHHPSDYGNITYMGSIFHFNWQDWNDWRGWMLYDNEEANFEFIENKACPFTQKAYETICDWSDADFKEEFKNKLVRITVSSDYDKVSFKDVIHRIEQVNPVSVDVIDNTILDKTIALDSDDEETDDNVKEIKEYVDEALKDDPKKEVLTELFSDVYNKALERMKEIE